MAGCKPELYRRMLAELGDYAGFAEEAVYFAFCHPEHHFKYRKRCLWMRYSFCCPKASTALSR